MRGAAEFVAPVAVAGWLAVGILTGATGCGGGGTGMSAPMTPSPTPDLLPCAGRTRTCYVRATGSDTDSGADPAHALATPLQAAQIVLDGYTIIVGPGVYPGGIVTARSDGAAPQGIQFIADTSGAKTDDRAGAVTIDTSLAEGAGAGFNLSHSAGSAIDGFTILNAPDAGIVIKSGSDDFIIQNCTVHDNSGDGIRVQDSAGVLVFNNLVYGNGGFGVGIVGTSVGSPDARVYSNTIVGNADHGVTIGTTDAASPHAAVHNNIVQDNDSLPPQESIKVITSPRSDLGYDGDYNLVFPATYTPAGAAGKHDLNGEASFIDAAEGDFHVPAGSAIINMGSALVVDDKFIQLLRSRTVVAGGSGDAGILDIGFHYPRR
jgi:parallel beta-helix repeat protein